MSGALDDDTNEGGTNEVRVLVIIPTYDERENLPLVLARVRASVPAAQKALYHRAKLNSAACFGRYKVEMEKDVLAA